MLRLIGIFILFFLAAVGAYTLLVGNEKDVETAKNKIERAYDAAKKELKK